MKKKTTILILTGVLLSMWDTGITRNSRKENDVEVNPACDSIQLLEMRYYNELQLKKLEKKLERYNLTKKS